MQEAVLEPPKAEVIDALSALRDRFTDKNHLNNKSKAQDKRNHLTLVELQFALQLSNLPKSTWEAISTLYNEYIQFRHLHLTADEINAGKERYIYQRDWIHHLLLFSQSVGGWQRDGMVAAMTADKAWEPKPAASGIHGNPENGQPEGKEVRRAKLFG